MFFFPVGMSHGSLALFPLVVMCWRASSFLDAYDVGWKKNRLQMQLNKKVSNWQNGLKTTERAIARVTNLHWTCLVHIDAAYVCLGPITLHAMVGVYPSVPAAWVDNQKSVLAVNFLKNGAAKGLTCCTLVHQRPVCWLAIWFWLESGCYIWPPCTRLILAGPCARYPRATSCVRCSPRRLTLGQVLLDD